MTEIVVQKWEESERGWGTRPDGYSIHLNELARERYVKNYWSKMPDETPDEYSRPHGTPYSANVDQELYDRVLKDGNFGLRFWDNKYPGDGGKDGWK